MDKRYIAFKQTIRIVEQATWDDMALHGAPIITIGTGDFDKIKELIYREYYNCAAANLPLLAEIVDSVDDATHFTVKVPYKWHRIYAITDLDLIDEDEEVLLLRRLKYELHPILDIKKTRE